MCLRRCCSKMRLRDSLSTVAGENRGFKEDWQKNHRRYYQIGGLTIQMESELPITDTTFAPKFKLFEVNGPGEDTIIIKHYFSLPDLDSWDLRKEVFRSNRWVIYRSEDSWIYVERISDYAGGDKYIRRVAVFNHDHTRAMIYNRNEETFRKGGLHALTLFTTDQIILARILADREGCYLHSSGVVFEGKGLLFVGRSGAGKSTMVTMLKNRAEILCDDRMIARRWQDGVRIHGTWSHGDVPDVSAGSAPLRAIFFLEKAQENRLIPLDNKREVIKKLLDCLVKPFVTVDWWDKMLSLLERMSYEVPYYILRFDKSGRVVDLLKHL